MTEGAQLVRAEWAALMGSVDAGDHILAIQNNGLTDRSVRRTVRGTDGEVVGSWTGVVDEGPHGWSMGRLFEGALPAGGMAYVAAVAVPPAPQCVQHVDVVPIVEPFRREAERLWDCRVGSRFVRVQSVTVPELHTVGINVAAPTSRFGIFLEVYTASGRQLGRRSLAVDDQIAGVTTRFDPGMYFIVTEGNDLSEAYELSMNFLE